MASDETPIGTAPNAAPMPADAIGRSLWLWRLLRRIKQAHAAEMLGVSQTTISRWESGAQALPPDKADALRRLMSAHPDSPADGALLRLVEESAAPVHLICDASHTLLAASAARRRDWSLPAEAMKGRSLWPYATEAIVQAERRLGDAGWFEPAPPSVTVATGENGSTVVPIHESRVTWTRLPLSDGSFARLVRTVSAGPPGNAGLQRL